MSTQKIAGEHLTKKLLEIDKIVQSKMPKAEAMEHIKYYRKGAPKELKSIWIGQDFIDTILSRAANEQINGVRVYLAKYKKGVGNIGDDKADKLTMILAPTVSGFVEGGMDIEDAYFNYGQPCPPACNDDEAEKP